MAGTWTNAGTADDDFRIESVVYAPDPVVKGKSVTLSLTGVLKGAVSGGGVSLTIRYGIIAVAKETVALAAAEAGAFTAEVTFSVPADSPSGAYTVQAVVVDQDDREIGAVDLGLPVS